ncbi:hypothetical protein BDB01DRAFT_483371 [Pilobolus umbonatus]|nr:hypothetical protein BDB01DRAFT_483371 [Pilobolus umbonatus]
MDYIPCLFYPVSVPTCLSLSLLVVLHQTSLHLLLFLRPLHFIFLCLSFSMFVQSALMLFRERSLLNNFFH